MVDTKANAPTQRVREAHDKARGRGGGGRRASAPEEEDEEGQCGGWCRERMRKKRRKTTSVGRGCVGWRRVMRMKTPAGEE